ncbi:MAG: hypothetical protein IJZ62_03850 [Clostridia bacterium]|nr:hypothetical protein [Clostridia bacterium]
MRVQMLNSTFVAGYQGQFKNDSTGQIFDYYKVLVVQPDTRPLEVSVSADVFATLEPMKTYNFAGELRGNDGRLKIKFDYVEKVA